VQALSFGFGPLEAEFWRWMFLMIRVGAAMLAVPLFGAAQVPAQVRASVAGAVALLVAAWTSTVVPPVLFSASGLLGVGGEVLVGLALGSVLQFAFAAPVIAAEIIGGGMGMSIASTVDPNTGAHSPALGQYFSVVLMLVFLSVGGHLHWIALVVRSYDVFPPGQTWLGAERIGAIAGFAGTMLATAVTLALPVTLVLLLVQVATGVLSRSAPALNLFSLGLPAGIVAGMAALIAAAPLLTDRMTDLTQVALDATAGILVK
jgi:flagellar biosynthetic protein FliR